MSTGPGKNSRADTTYFTLHINTCSGGGILTLQLLRAEYHRRLYSIQSWRISSSAKSGTFSVVYLCRAPSSRLVSSPVGCATGPWVLGGNKTGNISGLAQQFLSSILIKKMRTGPYRPDYIKQKIIREDKQFYYIILPWLNRNTPLFYFLKTIRHNLTTRTSASSQ